MSQVYSMKNMVLYGFIVILIVNVIGCSGTEVIDDAKILRKDVIIKTIYKDVEKFNFPPYVRIDSVSIDTLQNSLTIFFNKRLSYRPYRPADIDQIYNQVYTLLGLDKNIYTLQIFAGEYSIEELVPNFYRLPEDYDITRTRRNVDHIAIQVIKNSSKPNVVTNGLQDRNIALWQSHGWYYDNGADRWMWQRPRMWGTVEDLIPTSFTIPFIIPMLENAGANVYVPRERDVQTNIAICDNDYPMVDSFAVYEAYAEGSNEWQTEKPGYNYETILQPLIDLMNPFKDGSYSFIKTSKEETAYIKWTPVIPEDGEYSVYISYADMDENITAARYQVHHAGGVTEFSINQAIGGGMFHYLGTFTFRKGYHEHQFVKLSNKSNVDGFVSGDAVRFGGGMANVMREGRENGRPQYVTGARYHLQTEGVEDTLTYYMSQGMDDYGDDYRGRSEWVNYLYGNPFGPNGNREINGLGIPMDLSLAFHTDAGITRNDKVIGTLLIHSTYGADSTDVFPDGMSRLANRDFADILQTEIVETIKAKYDTVWNRRQIRNEPYSEAFRPNVPAALLELLSHQNFLDMKFMLDPRFRFDVSRAIYKGMLKYLSVHYDFEYVVQPLPVTHFSALFDTDGNIKLSWQPVSDPQEPSADAKQYIVYTRLNGGGFDNGVLVDKPTYVLDDVYSDSIYSFKVTAVNEGGESFPSEILSICKKDDFSDPVLIVNCFDRLSGPATVEERGYEGFLYNEDFGIPYKYDLSFVGEQYDFNPRSIFLTNDMPGHGASHSNYETQIIAGNTFDYPFMHGSAIAENGCSYVSVSDEMVMEGKVSLKEFTIVDLIFGEEKETKWTKSYGDSLYGTQFSLFPLTMQNAIREYTKNGGNLLLSGAYIATDIWYNTASDTSWIDFANNVLRYQLVTPYGSKSKPIEYYGKEDLGFPSEFSIVRNLNKYQYAVEAPDAINAVNGAVNIFSYKENDRPAATFYNGDYKVFAMGFPFESISCGTKRNEFMKAVLQLFKK